MKIFNLLTLSDFNSDFAGQSGNKMIAGLPSGVSILVGLIKKGMGGTIIIIIGFLKYM